MASSDEQRISDARTMLRDAIDTVDALCPMLPNCRSNEVKDHVMAFKEHTEEAVADMAKLTGTNVDGMTLTESANNVWLNLSMLDVNSRTYQKCMQIIDELHMCRIRPSLFAFIMETCLTKVVYRRRVPLDAFLIGFGLGAALAYMLSV